MPTTQREKDIAKHHKHNQWLIFIGGLKLLKGLLFILLGFGALKLLHKDIVDLLTRWFIDMRFDPESRFINLLLDKAALIDDHRLKQISFGIFCYAALDLVEGTGLALEKTWAEYLTLILTASFLPWEFFEIIRHFTWVKVVLVLINVLVVLYLLFILQIRAREREAAREQSSA
ncbi:DUF2127 domain-containing protein [Acidipila rosea]|uniref:Uncharacterized membrane protein (DUF2068 family) n=1 Tax=Acidipila rosea TaxID=768535 RepID=A0A4R1LAA8_9BACT|nr:DUF2127 domain-containing protein [Acidipila rosea]MBW4027128.1 DUF2127 domain-containing protein [Acidobacteriota bacterium]MBW4045707.1 DUF2127 domain-containing protein [Acidobacteriota bacterium]TCK74367.1 uncharacterized membrane protein (DUF2068 family) [Acidipila rosea]